MPVDFTPYFNGEMKILELSRGYSVQDLREATNASVDWMLALIDDLTDADVTFDPVDPEAHDPFAKPGEEHIGWNLAHLIAHVTSSSEEWATYSSLLARGVAYGPDPRLRFETDWKTVTTKAQCVQRLEESRRMRLGYLDTWPDSPNLELLRELSPRFIERFGDFNATACFLFGLSHEVGHHEQMKEVKRQALGARTEA